MSPTRELRRPVLWIDHYMRVGDPRRHWDLFVWRRTSTGGAWPVALGTGASEWQSFDFHVLALEEWVK